MKFFTTAPGAKFTAVLALLLQLFMSVMDGSIVTAALPILAGEFKTSGSVAVWIVTIYQLAITMCLLPLASLGEKTSYKKIFVAGSALFTLSSALCACSPGFWTLVAARAAQGFGAACVMSVNPALVRLIYPPQYLGRGMAFNAVTVALAAACGPALAGLILSAASWRWLFLLNLAPGVLAIFFAVRDLPQNRSPRDAASFDLAGALLNAAAFGGIFYSVSALLQGHGAALSLGLLFLSAAVAVIYIRREAAKPDPIFPLDLFKNRSFSLAVITSVLSFTGQNIAMIALPFLFFQVWGFSEIMLGALMTPWPVMTVIFAPLAARYAENHNPGRSAACGMAFFIAGLLLLAFSPSGEKGVFDICWRMALCGIGFGLFQTPNNIMMITSTPFSRSGAAGGMQATARLAGQTAGALIASLVFAYRAPGLTSIRLCLLVACCAAILAMSMSFRNSLPRE